MLKKKKKEKGERFWYKLQKMLCHNKMQKTIKQL